MIGNAVLENWGVAFSTLIAAGGLVLVTLSLQSLLSSGQGETCLPKDATRFQAASVAFPGLFPPIAVTVPLIFSVPFRGWETKLGILAMGLGLIVVNLLLMLKSKSILRVVGPVPLQLFGAVFGVLQLALGLQFFVAALSIG